MDLISKSESFVFHLFKDKLSEKYIYHNYNHTLRVVSATKELIQNIELLPEKKEVLLLAAWFHDTGYAGSIEKDEHESCKIARQFLERENVHTDIIREVERLIHATCITTSPTDLLQEIIKDADMSHLADPNYSGISELLRAEWETTRNMVFSDLEWAVTNRNLLLNKHKFYTDYAKEHWQPLKDENIVALQKRILKLASPEELKEGKKIKTERENRPERGIDTMFRVTLNNHTRLSEIADSKANILISVNAIIISIALTVLIPKLDSPKNIHLVIPTFVLTIFSVTTIVFAILSTRPKVTGGTFTREEVKNKKVNILFFGNFFKMPLPEYEWAMNELMKDRDGLYNALIKDLYFLGLVLNKKYKLLRTAYGIFMLGIIASVIVFVISFYQAGVGR